MSMTDLDVRIDPDAAPVQTDTPSVQTDTPEKSDKEAILAVAKAIHRVKDPDIKVADGHPWMHDAEVFLAAARALSGYGRL